MGEQGHDEDDGLCRGAQPIADRACRSAEGLMPRVASAPLFLARMDTASALAGLASGMARPLGAEYACGVHDAPPGCAWKTWPRGVCLDPCFLYNFTAPRLTVVRPTPRSSALTPAYAPHHPSI